jgi:diguanylate cyclase (GGDEF)-like protein
MTLRAPWAALAPDGLVGGVQPSEPERGTSRRRGSLGGRLANAALTHLPLAIVILDADSRPAFWNEQAAALFGTPRPMGADTPSLTGLLAGIANLTFQQRDRIIAFAATHIAAGDRVEPESWLRIALGRDRRITLRICGIGARHWMLVVDDGAMALAAGRGDPARTGGDAWLDPLTGLANRRHFNQTLHGLAENAAPGSRPTLLMIDLDRFKLVNDTFGPPVGDALLCLVAQRLRRETREEDLLARLGGDEFVILLTNGEWAEALAARVIAILSRPFLVEGHIAHIGASVGIARFPEHGSSADDLTRHADLALYDAKSAGGGAWRIFDPTIAPEATARRNLETDLRKAVSLGELSIAYQARFDVGQQALTGFAAAPHWNHPIRGAVPPERFVALAEDVGCIAALAARALKAACDQAARWPASLTVAMTVSRRQLADGERLFDAVQTALQASGLAPDRLELEFAETTLPAGADVLHRLRALGVRIVMDGFGPGRTILDPSPSFPFHKIRIDRRFVATPLGDRDVALTARATAADPSITATADWMETAEQEVLLDPDGRIRIQDILIGRPIQAASIDALLHRHAVALDNGSTSR